MKKGVTPYKKNEEKKLLNSCAKEELNEADTRNYRTEKEGAELSTSVQ